MIEIWKVVSGFDGCYEVSSFGNIRSMTRTVDSGHGAKRTHKGKMLSLYPNKAGYLRVKMTNGSASREAFVHKLVAEAFVLNPENLPFVNHLDGVKENNSATNLEWCTRSRNMQHAYDNGLITKTKVGENHPRCVLTEQSAKLVKKLLSEGNRPSSVARTLKISRAAVYGIHYGQTWRNV